MLAGQCTCVVRGPPLLCPVEQQEGSHDRTSLADMVNRGGSVCACACVCCVCARVRTCVCVCVCMCVNVCMCLWHDYAQANR